MNQLHRPSASKDWVSSALWIFAVAAIGIASWYAIIYLFGFSKLLLPTPAQVAVAAYQRRSELFQGTLSTTLAALTGLLVAVGLGSLIAVAFSLSRKVRLAFFPYIVFLQTVPIVAIAPLLIIWSGYRFRTVVIVTVIICLFPIINNVTAGLLAVDRELSDLFRLYGVGKRKRLMRLQIPGAVESLMLGTQTSSGLAVIGAIVAEFFIGNGQNFAGLGALMQQWQAFHKTDALMAALFASMFVGLVLFGAVRLVSATVLRRWIGTSPVVKNAG
ncbi:MAG: ABC transporter permease [Pirellulaceae bacterium]|nr:ABC transporter permease [Pirellulaceae bacterium]